MRLSLVLGIIGASLSLIIIIAIILSTQVGKKDIVSEYGCSLTLGIDKPSTIRLPEGLYSGGLTLGIKMYYCNVNGFDDIRLVNVGRDKGMADSYQFIMRPGSVATITFLLDISELLVSDDRSGKEYRGIEAVLFYSAYPAFEPIITTITYEEGVIIKPIYLNIISDNYLLVEYAIEVKEDVKERIESYILGPNTYFVRPFYALPPLYITIRM